MTTIETVCREFRLDPKDVLGPCRRAYLVSARTAIARQLRGHGLSLPAIGRLLHRHHTTVLWLLRGGRHGKAALIEVLSEREAK